MPRFLSNAQLLAEAKRCESCEEKPCTKACPCDCSPADFIMAIRCAEPADFKRAASMIMSRNPLGATCGNTCPEKFCMKACVHRSFDNAINIKDIQATILHRAQELGVLPEFKTPVKNGKTIAIVGGGPAAIGAAAILAQQGYSITIFEKTAAMGGSCNSIPEARLNRELLALDLALLHQLGDIRIIYNQTITSAELQTLLQDFAAVLVAIGRKSEDFALQHEKLFRAGDLVNGQTLVVQAVAHGKNIAEAMIAFLNGTTQPACANPTKSAAYLAGIITMPVSLEADFFGRKILSPFLISASPHSDGLAQAKLAYEAGWAGLVMKNSFDNVHIHIPNEYMFMFNPDTYANCDNVSEHPLDQVCREVEQLIKQYPERLTMAGTGGPVTGNDENDRRGWQSNTLKLERAGAMGVEYSLSCPQGGDGTEGNIVSQNAKLTAKIVDWIMEISDPNIPKLFKLTGAVTSVYTIVAAIREVFAKYPHKQAGITLANSFPTLAFRKGKKTKWDEGIVVGMSGDGVTNISYLTLANVANMGMIISGNGGPMNYRAAANFLALGVKTVQFCSILLKYGVRVIDELHSGLSYFLQQQDMKSVTELIGRALPKPITDFNDLSPVKNISAVVPELCEHCGNCARCPYQAITLDTNKIPYTNPAKCVGCGICVRKCFAGALFMKQR